MKPSRMLVGVCKDCTRGFVLSPETRVEQRLIWECPFCYCPNAWSDFWAVRSVLLADVRGPESPTDFGLVEVGDR